MSWVPPSQTTRTGLTLNFHRLESCDLDDVMTLERRVQTHPWTRSSFEDCLTSRHQCWLAKSDGQLVGFAVVAWAGGEAELLNIAVDPTHQGQGVGRCLLRTAIELARPQAEMMFLEVRISNHRAIGFYYEEDFFEVGLRRDYYPAFGGREDALVLARAL